MTFSETMVAEDPTEAHVAFRAVAAAHLAALSAHGTDALATRILA